MTMRRNADGSVEQIPAGEVAADATESATRRAVRQARQVALDDTPSDASLSQVIADLNAVKARLREA